jgi:signal transduction histidine kinase
MTTITASPVKRRVRRPPLRVQLTVLYAGLFLLLAVVVLAVSGLLVRQGSTNQNGDATSRNAVLDHHFDIGPAAVALIAAVIALALAWWIAGRFLRPLRTMNAAAREISATNLHRRLGLDGPDDELTDLGQTLDALFARLEASFDAQRHFVANASHELRTPLAGLQTLLEVALADPDADTDTLRSVCQEALALGQHQERLVKALLTLATSERGIETWEPFDLANIAGNVATGHGHEADRQNIRIETTLAVAPATGDPKLVELLVTNLIDNALRHNTTAGRIDISTTCAPGRATITVSNTGPTIPPSDIDRLFQPFQQVGSQRVSHINGHGLGLTIVAAIALAHQATITAHPRPQGGLDIAVSFPSTNLPSPQPSRTSR